MGEKHEWKIPPHREFLAGDLLAQSLSKLGVTVAFGLHGGHLDAFLIGCTLSGIRLIDTRHETPAVQAAESYAKLTGSLGLCFVTANSGFCNALPGLATAFADRSPILMVTSSPPLQDAETNSLQGFHDQVVIARPMSKFAHRITTPEEIPRIVSYAYKTAMSGIPGPVVLDFPIDVLFSPPRMGALAMGSVLRETAIAPGPSPGAVKKVLEMWRASKRPAIIVGTGASRTTSRDDPSTSPLLNLAEATGTPIFHSQKYSPSLPFDHELRGGNASSLAIVRAIGKPQPDFVLLLGARTGFLLGGRSGALIPNSDCKIIQVDLDGGEIGKSHAVDLGIVSDSLEFISAILTSLKQEGTTLDRRTEWLEDIKAVKSLPSQYKNDETTRPDGRLHPYHAMSAIMTSLPPSSIIIMDGGESGVWSSSLTDLARPSTAIVATGYLGFLGNGWGYSLGAALACPDRLVVNIHGDGSAGFHIQELDTYARHGLNVLSVVFNNNFWGMSVAGQDLLYEKSDPARPVSSLSESCRYDIVAGGFNCASALATTIDEVEKAIKDLGAKGKPGLVNVLVSRSPVTEVTKSMVGKTEDKDWIVVPYYDNIPRARYPIDEKKENGTVH
jgi:thiamine pyrophosphate-dependent acetolactate synthase large subunit-like protein